MLPWGVRTDAERMAGYHRVIEARSTVTSSARLAELARDEILPVRVWTARNHNTPVTALYLLAQDDDSHVRRTALSHPRTPANALIRLADDRSNHFHLAHHPNTPDDVRRDVMAAGACRNCSKTCAGWRVYTHRDPHRSRYVPTARLRRTDAERADQMLSWSRSDQAFFASGACHILAWAFVETHPDYRIYGLLRRHGKGIQHVIAGNGCWAFDHCGWTLATELFQAYDADPVPILTDLETFCLAYHHYLPEQFAFSPWQRAREYVARYNVSA